ncbi:hypothetical protein O203_17750 [Ectopseudomonas chengduensis]|nr:hypothetical protein O203_17750 [Pseudomonas chengduensis]
MLNWLCLVQARQRKIQASSKRLIILAGYMMMLHCVFYTVQLM